MSERRARRLLGQCRRTQRYTVMQRVDEDALTKSDSYAYDGNSNLTSHTDRVGNVINYTYDALNRLTQAQYNIPGKHGPTLQSSIAYAWDAGNRPTSAVDSIAGTITRQYNGLNRLTQEVTPQGTVNYTYDNAGRRLTMQVAGQSQVSYTWDNANRLSGIAQGGQSVGLSYDNANRRTCLTCPTGPSPLMGTTSTRGLPRSPTAPAGAAPVRRAIWAI